MTDEDFIEMFNKDKEDTKKDIEEILTFVLVFSKEFDKLGENINKKDYIYFSIMRQEIRQAAASVNKAVYNFALIR